MILLLGGTSETAAIASALAEAGLDVLVSTATDEPLAIGEDGRISRRVGRLDEAAMAELTRQKGIALIVDATHPYASAAKATAARAAAACSVPYVAFARPGSLDGAAATARPADDLHFAADHELAAELACSLGGVVLLTTGANNLHPYAAAARRGGVALVARVLPRAESLAACEAAGIAPQNVIAQKGPFTLEQNLELIRRFGVAVLVTKDSGQAGGLEEKLQAARRSGCHVVVVRRPPPPASGLSDVPSLVQEVLSRMPR